MSWAAFHVLEVMSSPKYHQKRVGYLGAVQSFRADTEVLMLATNLLKKDIVSPTLPSITLPLLTIPHIITPSLAISILSDILPCLTHSQPTIRKKAVVNLYRLSLVYPEAFRLAWPKIKERLMDEHEDSSVTAAVINVVCELGWRRPQDFLPLAPRLFELLVDSGNNWMAIKIIKLFASLTPLEPRLVRKLLRPLTNIIQTTSAMSLLYECINGVIQGGILDGAEGIREGEAIAQLCVEKLRGMLVMDEDPNLRYVALLAFNRIVPTHPMLVSTQQDVIMSCLDDNDISIRLQALELVSSMVNSDSIEAVVNRLVTQLQTSPIIESQDSYTPVQIELTPAADIDGYDPEERLAPTRQYHAGAPPLPHHYRLEVLHRILDVCSRDTYSNIPDFEWYVDVLVHLVRLVPPTKASETDASISPVADETAARADVATRIGVELRNVAVRVKSVRPEATRAAETLILLDNRGTLFPISGTSSTNLLEPIAWVVGEYAEYLTRPDQTLASLIHPSNLSLSEKVLSSYIQAIPKLFVRQTSRYHDWDPVKQSTVLLLLARITDFLDKLSSHPDLDVQERAIEFLELLRLTTEAITSTETEYQDVPLLISTAIPSLFTGLDLNPVAVGAQKKVPIPPNLDLDQPLNPQFTTIQRELGDVWSDSFTQDEFYQFYHIPESTIVTTQPQKEILSPIPVQAASYQSLPEELNHAADVAAKKRAIRRERNKDDPFYIGHDEGSSGSNTPFNRALHGANTESLDLDAIPIVDLALDGIGISETPPPGAKSALKQSKLKTKRKAKAKKIEIIGDDTLDFDDGSEVQPGLASSAPTTTTFGTVGRPAKVKKSLLEVDSSGLGHLSLEDDGGFVPSIENIARKEAEEAEMARLMTEIERTRLEMQRDSERIHSSHEIPAEGTLVKRKKKKKKVAPSADEPKAAVKKKTVRKASVGMGDEQEQQPVSQADEGPAVVKKKKKKKIAASSVKNAGESTEAGV
ncbi:AP-3 complex subunit delta [Myotisia sp. PD_48]|nr:AP-3 complex subunit delta [Myotisia sp. PD_48]